MSKYRTGQLIRLADGETIEILSVVRSCHGNTSRITYRILGADGIEKNRSLRPVRTAHLTELIARRSMVNA